MNETNNAPTPEPVVDPMITIGRTAAGKIMILVHNNLNPAAAVVLLAQMYQVLIAQFNFEQKNKIEVAQAADIRGIRG